MWLFNWIILILLLLLPFFILFGTKALIYGIDMVYIFLFVSYYSKDFFAKYTSGYSILFWCVLLGLLTIFIYFKFLSLFHTMLPRVSHILHFIIVYLGISFTIPRLTSFFTGLLLKKETSHLSFLDNPTANKIAYIFLFLIITSITYKKRINYIDGCLPNNINNTNISSYSEYIPYITKQKLQSISKVMLDIHSLGFDSIVELRDKINTLEIENQKILESIQIIEDELLQFYHLTPISQNNLEKFNILTLENQHLTELYENNQQILKKLHTLLSDYNNYFEKD